MNDVESIMEEMCRNYHRLIEANMVKTIEAHLGRVPNDAEVVKHCHSKRWPDREEFFWKDRLLFTATKPTLIPKGDGKVEFECKVTIN